MLHVKDITPMAAGALVGLDIGTQQIKVAEVRFGKSGLSVTGLGVAATPYGVMQNNIITDPQLMGQAIRQLLRDSGITSKRVVGSVAGQSAVVIRIIEVPKMTEAELKETMKWEVERHVPFAPNETVIDYQALPVSDPSQDANPNMEVLLAVAQQDIVNNFVNTLFASKLDPIAIDIEPLAASRALLEVVNGVPVGSSGFGGNYDKDHPDTVAIVNIGASNTDIAIFQNGQLSFPRSLPLAGDSLTRAIAESLGCPLDHAERVKRDQGTVQLDRMAVYTGTAYGDEAGYDAPQFRDDDVSFEQGRGTSRVSGRISGRMSGRLHDDVPLVNPFDLSSDLDAPAGGTPSQRLNPFANREEIERTQPMSRKTLNLAGRPKEEAALSFPTDEPTFGPTVDAEVGAEHNRLRDQIFEAIAPILGELATELRRSLDYYRSRAQGRSVDRVILIGGSANLGNLAPFLQNELQVPVSVGDPFAGLSVSSKHYDPDFLRTVASGFTIAVGLAARDAVFSANPTPKKQSSRTKKAGQAETVTTLPTS